MKFIFTVLIFIIAWSIELNAQIKVTTKFNETYIGFVKERTKKMLTLETLEKITIEIPTDQIDQMTKAISIVTTKNGTTYEGHIVSKNGKKLTIVTKGNIRIPIANDQISQIVSAEGTPAYSSSRKRHSEERTPVYSSRRQRRRAKFQYPMLGVTLLTPGGINLVGGYQFRNVGVRFTGGILPHILLALQGNFMLNLSKSRNFEHNLSIGAGLLKSEKTVHEFGSYGSRSSETDTYFIGTFYDLNYHGFFLETGIALPEGRIDNHNNPGPQLMIQFGLVYRFTR